MVITDIDCETADETAEATAFCAPSPRRPHCAVPVLVTGDYSPEAGSPLVTVDDDGWLVITEDPAVPEGYGVVASPLPPDGWSPDPEKLAFITRHWRPEFAGRNTADVYDLLLAEHRVSSPPAIHVPAAGWYQISWPSVYSNITYTTATSTLTTYSTYHSPFFRNIT